MNKIILSLLFGAFVSSTTSMEPSKEKLVEPQFSKPYTSVELGLRMGEDNYRIGTGSTVNGENSKKCFEILGKGKHDEIFDPRPVKGVLIGNLGNQRMEMCLTPSFEKHTKKTISSGEHSFKTLTGQNKKNTAHNDKISEYVDCIFNHQTPRIEFLIPQKNLFVHSTLENAKLYYINGEFAVFRNSNIHKVQKHNVSNQFRYITEDQLIKFLNVGYFYLKKTENEYFVDARFRLLGGGPWLAGLMLSVIISGYAITGAGILTANPALIASGLHIATLGEINLPGSLIAPL